VTPSQVLSERVDLILSRTTFLAGGDYVGWEETEAVAEAQILKEQGEAEEERGPVRTDERDKE